MSATELSVAQQTAAAAAPAPRAVIDYDFPSVLAAPPKQRFVLWMMAAIIAMAALGLAIARVDIIVSANGKIISSDSQIVIQPIETTIPLHKAIMEQADFVKGNVDTNFIERTFGETGK